MHSIELLLIGDIHFGSSKEQTGSDIKDPNFPPTVTERLDQKKLQSVVRGIINEFDSIDGILFTGDLADKGKESDYADCVKYLDKSLKLSDKSKWADEQLHVAPGNHDIFLTHVDTEGNDLDKKIKPLNGFWANYNRDGVVPYKSRITDISSKYDGKVKLISMNSCIGCREKRYLPETIKDELYGFIRDLVDGKSDEVSFDIIGETLDTPAFEADDIDAISDTIRFCDPMIQPVLLGHHNILPQVGLRVEMYTEVVNSGKVRSLFSSSGKTIIYCHGHIHEARVEVISSPADKYSQLVCVSAPYILDGYMKLIISFSGTGYPLDCKIVQYELKKDGGVTIAKEWLIKFKMKNVSDAISADTLKIYDKLKNGEERYFNDLFEELKEELGVTEEAFEGLLNEGRWTGLFTVSDPCEDRKFSRIKRIPK